MSWPKATLKGGDNFCGKHPKQPAKLWNWLGKPASFKRFAKQTNLG